MTTRLATVLAVLLAVGGQGSAKPNFSGEWKMNATKSDFGVLPPPSSMRRTITHAEPTLSIVEDQRSDLGDVSTTRKYVTDGTPTTFMSQGADVKSSATWDGDALVVVSKVDAVGLSFNDRMTLSPDGRTLVSNVHISSPQGEVDIMVAFEKQ
jgi:hypothetical protein